MRMEITTEDVKWPKTMFEDEYPRSDGLHLGTIQSWIRKKMNPVRGGGGFDDMELTAEIGLLWERVLSKVMGEKYALRPPPIEVDGIWLSPDGIGPDPIGIVPVVIEEYKATWKSTNSAPDDNFQYMTQIKSYCRGYDTTVAVMHIFHIMGNYRGSGPIYRVARLVFTTQELEQNWEMVLRCRKEMEDDPVSK